MGMQVHNALASAGFEAVDLYVEQSSDGQSVTIWSSVKEIVRDAAGTLIGRGFKAGSVSTGTDEMVGFWQVQVSR